MTDRDDGWRFCFKKHRYDDNYDLVDELGILPTIEIPDGHAQVLCKMLAEQHRLRIDKTNQFAKLHALLDLVKQESEIDKDGLIACINNSGDFEWVKHVLPVGIV